MLLSEYIEKLKTMLREHGDHEVTDSYDVTIGEPEFDEGGDGRTPSFVLAEKG